MDIPRFFLPLVRKCPPTRGGKNHGAHFSSKFVKDFPSNLRSTTNKGRENPKGEEKPRDID